MKNYFVHELFVLKLFGYSLTGNESKSYKIYSFLYKFSSVVYLLLLMHELTKHNIDVIAELLSYMMGMIVALAKGYIVYRKRTKICELLGIIQQEPFLPDPKRGGNQEIKIVKECISLTKIQMSVYVFFSLSTVITNIFYPIYRRVTSSNYHDWVFPYGPFTVLGVTRSPNYEIAFFYQNISMVFYGATFITVDLLLAAVLAHISYQFKILQNYIRQIVTISRHELASNLRLQMNVDTSPETPSFSSNTSSLMIPWTISKPHLAKVVRYHQKIIYLAEEAENLFSGLLLFVFTGTLSIICLSIYAATMATNQTQILTFLFEALGTSFQVLIICYWGEQVSHESNLVGQVAYETNFVGTDTKFQKALAFIIRRSQNTSQLTAGKFAVVSLITFSWILRTSYSSYMVLRGANATRT